MNAWQERFSANSVTLLRVAGWIWWKLERKKIFHFKYQPCICRLFSDMLTFRTFVVMVKISKQTCMFFFSSCMTDTFIIPWCRRDWTVYIRVSLKIWNNLFLPGRHSNYSLRNYNKYPVPRARRNYRYFSYDVMMGFFFVHAVTVYTAVGHVLYLLH